MEVVASNASHQYNVRRFFISSTNRTSVDQSTTNFTWRPVVDANEQITRYAVRSVHFPMLAGNWDTKYDIPTLYIEWFGTGNTSKGYWKVFLNDNTVNTVSKLKDFLEGCTIASSRAQWISSTDADPRSSTSSVFGTATGTVGLITMTISTDLATLSYTSTTGNNVAILHNHNSLSNRMYYPSITNSGQISQFNLGEAAQQLNVADEILGLSSPIKVIAASATTPAFRLNLQPEQVLYLCSQRLSGAARSFPANTASGTNVQAIACIPIGGLNNQYIDFHFYDQTEYACLGKEQFDEIDFSLRYNKGGVVDLGMSNMVIELEVESVILKNTSRMQMIESIHMPNFNAQDTAQLLGKKRPYGFMRGKYM